LVDATAGENIITTTYDLSSYTTAEFRIDVATFGSGTANSVLIEISYDNGVSYTQSATTATPSSSSYITGGPITLTGTLTSQVVIRISNTSTSGRGVRLRNLELVASGSAGSPEVGFDNASSTQNETNTTFNVLIPVTLINHSVNVDLSVSINSSSTSEMSDYTLNTSSLSFTGDGTQNISIDINPDAGFDEETIIIDIVETTATSIFISTAQHTITVTDDETPPVPTLIITEVADPNNDTSSGRQGNFVEIYNTGDSDIDLSSSNIKLRRYTNGNTTFTDLTLSGTISGKGFYLVGKSTFEGIYGFDPNQTTSGVWADSNGDDQLALVDSNGVFDIFGVVGEDGTGTCHEFEDGRAERIASAKTPKSTWSEADWYVWADSSVSGCTNHIIDPQDAPGNFDPGAWIGAPRWKGTTDNNWTTATNWDTGVIPSSDADVFIESGLSNYPTVSTAVTINSLNIASGATLKATNTFTVSSATFNRNLSNGSQWYLISSPIVGETYDANWATSNSIPTSSLDTDNIGLSWYDNTSSDIDTDNGGSDTATGHWRYLQTDDSNNGTFGKGKGYGIIRSGSGLISFTGTGIYTSTQTTTITYGASNPNNYNLVGNPFTSFLNLGSFFTSNNTANLIGGTVWFWNGSSYDAKMSGITEDTNFEIAPGQGFFIEAGTAATSSDNISFDISGTDHNSTETFQKSSNITSSIYLNVNDGISNRYAKIYYVDGTTKGFDNGFDGKLFGGVSHNFAIYSNLLNDNTGNKYQVQSLPNTDYENMVIPIGLISVANSEIAFSAEVNNLPNGLKVQLEDRATGKFTNLNEANYTVVLNEKQDGSGRFFLHTSQKTLSVNSNILTTASIYKVNNQTLKINGLETSNASIAIYNILGKQILNKNLQTTNSFEVALPNMSTGVYVVKLYTKEGQLSTKIMID